MIETVSTTEGFEALAPEWDDLVRAMPRPSPFLLHGWLAEWCRHYGADAELRVHVARRDGRLVGALPLVQRRRAGVRVATFMGGPEAVLPDVLLAAGETSDVCAALARRLGESGCDVVDFNGLPEQSRIAAALGRLEVIQRIEAPVLDLTGDWDAVYREKTSSKKRSLHRRRRRQLADLGRVDVSVARSPDELGPALEEAFALHALRWDGRPDGSGFATTRGRSFHRAAMARLAAIEVARIVTLRVAGRAVAFHYYFALEGCMYVHRLAFDPTLARFSPGLVNTLDAIEAADAEGLRRVEFLGGDERYKVELADRFEPLYQGVGALSSARGRAYAAARMNGIRLRLRLKHSPRLRRLYFDGVAPVRRLARRSPIAS
ncbi:MAG TPA: GNAT family N-acetyltransferase [Solirubrobacteraceae bacterium]|nr:GNAT family N-acetyltransferase [Solirubrobacteraceae bacterium]